MRIYNIVKNKNKNTMKKLISISIPYILSRQYDNCNMMRKNILRAKNNVDDGNIKKKTNINF